MANRGLKKLEVLIDANAFSHLSKIEINRQKADKWLWKYLQVFTCTAVKNEFNAKINKKKIRTSTERSLNGKLTNNCIPKVRRLTKLEKNWLHPTYYRKLLRADDKGERHLICTAIELAKEKKIGQIIIVTDDYTARTDFMDNVLADIPFGQIWNTPDLLSYLYYTNDDISYGVAEDAIKDIIAIESMSWKKFKDPTDNQDDAKIKMIKYYIKKIQQIRFLKQKYH